MICFSANVRINSNIAHSAVQVQLSFYVLFYFFLAGQCSG